MGRIQQLEDDFGVTFIIKQSCLPSKFFVWVFGMVVENKLFWFV